LEGRDHRRGRGTRRRELALLKPTVRQLIADLEAGRTTAGDLVEECLARIEEPFGEGGRAFVAFDPEAARATAAAMDALRRANRAPSALAGIPVSVKDLFDVRGEVTRAGSPSIAGPPAAADAPAIARWRDAGLVLIGRTNMTEFAFSGVGLNPHYGTPANPWNREGCRIPGGSSSGAAVSVADGMAHGALGTDTGGSCRIPAALCGLAGYKPTQAEVPLGGVVPLSPSLDSAGVIARSVECCAMLFGVLRGRAVPSPLPAPMPPRLAILRNFVFDGADRQVLGCFERALEALSAAGAQVVDLELPALDTIAEMNVGGGFPAAESFSWHGGRIAEHGDVYDPRVLVRILRGRDRTAEDVAELRRRRAALTAAVEAAVSGFDAFLCPTVPLVAPPIDALAEDDEFTRVNLLLLRNPTVVNLIDGCSASLPIQAPGEPPVGLMVSGTRGRDDAVLRAAAWIESKV
jgi:aspartyl-tRNA(Asn)/glutamyl-tRNA(Gln) amidotransferase subunit A